MEIHRNEVDLFLWQRTRWPSEKKISQTPETGRQSFKRRWLHFPSKVKLFFTWWWLYDISSRTSTRSLKRYGVSSRTSARSLKRWSKIYCYWRPVMTSRFMKKFVSWAWQLWRKMSELSRTKNFKVHSTRRSSQGTSYWVEHRLKHIFRLWTIYIRKCHGRNAS